MSAPREEHRLLTDCGLPGVRDIPFGVHMCNFYRTREELAQALVPYFLAGLRNNERCIWITADPLPALDASAELRKAGLDVDQAIAGRALVVRDFTDWYAEQGRLKGSDVVELWLAEEARALAEGFSGLRITGNVTFLRPEDWALFMEYEALVDRAFLGRRIITLCTYRLGDCGATDVLEVMQRHSCTLDHPDQGWQILTGHAG
jgi:hypothetical protein